MNSLSVQDARGHVHVNSLVGAADSATVWAEEEAAVLGVGTSTPPSLVTPGASYTETEATTVIPLHAESEATTVIPLHAAYLFTYLNRRYNQ